MIDKLLAPHQTETKLQKAYGILCCILMAGALLLFLVIPEIMPLPAAAAVSVLLCAAMIVFRLYKLFSDASFAVIIAAAATAAGITAFFRRSFSTGLTEANPAMYLFCMIALFFGIWLAYSVLMHLIGDPHPTARGYVSALLSTLPLVFTVLIYLPGESYLNNVLEFKFILSDFLPILAERALVLAVVLPVLICSAKKPVPQIFRALMCGLFLCTYLQYLCMNRSLPSAMGEHVDWSQFGKETVLTAVIWIVLLILPFILPVILRKYSEKIRKAEVVLPAVLGGIEAVTLGILLLTTPYPRTWLVPSGEGQFTVSPEKNIILMILDEADADRFEAILEAEPEKAAALHDFTYYNNCCTVYDSTTLSIPQLLTGTELLPEGTLEEWYSSIFKSPQAVRLFGTLHENQYAVNLYGDFACNYNYMTECADNLMEVEADLIIDAEAIPAFFMQLSRYRYLPYCLKRYCEVTEESLPNMVSTPVSGKTGNGAFVQGIANLQMRQDGKNAFIMQHLKGPHYPLETKSMEQEYALCLDLVSSYLDKLKELGVYDDALILIASDHGVHNKKGAFPILLVKEPHRTAGEMAVSDAPVSLNDLPKTFLIASGLYQPEQDDALFASSIYDYQSGDLRERIWFAREEFDYAGEKIVWKKPFRASQTNAFLGYTFIGDRTELKRVTETQPPDLIIEMDSSY